MEGAGVGRIGAGTKGKVLPPAEVEEDGSCCFGNGTGGEGGVYVYDGMVGAE